MKKLLYFLITLSVMLSCNDEFLVRDDPKGITDSKFWKSTPDAEAALGTCYQGLPHGAYHYTKPYVSIIALEGMNDNMYHSGNYLGDAKTIGTGTGVPSLWHPFVMWESYYRYIRRCSRFLEHIKKPYFVDEKERQKMIGQAYVLRAFYHNELFNYFGGGEGIPIVDHVLLPEEVFKKRSSVKETVDFIISDLDAAINNKYLPNKWTEDKSSRVSKAVAYSIKASIALQSKRYGVAKKAAKTIIDMNLFDLYTDSPDGKNFRDLFRYVGKINKERILYTSRGLKESWFRSMIKSMSGGQGASNPTLSIVNAFETLSGKTIDEDGNKEEYIKNPYFTDRDPRLKATIWVPDSVFINHKYTPFNADSEDHISKEGASKTGFVLTKFIDPEDATKTYAGGLDFMIIRYAEILLIYVEALIENGEYANPDVVKYLNKIRNRSGMPNVDVSKYNTQEKLRQLLRRERRVELAFEGKRFQDIRRWGIGVEVMNGPLYGAYNPTTASPILIETRTYKSPRNDYLPIPQKEIDANENMSQNAGW